MASAGLTAFANAVAAQTGMDPRVIIAWAAGEGHPGDLPGYFNWLNIQAATARALGVPYNFVGPAGTAAFGTMARGVQATVLEIQALGIQGGGTPATQIASIAASPWASSHYGGPGGPNLVADFVSLFGQAALGAAGTPSPVTPPGLTGPQGRPSRTVGNPPPGLEGPIGVDPNAPTPFPFTASAFANLTWALSHHLPYDLARVRKARYAMVKVVR